MLRQKEKKRKLIDFVRRKAFLSLLRERESCPLDCIDTRKDNEAPREFSCSSLALDSGKFYFSRPCPHY